MPDMAVKPDHTISDTVMIQVRLRRSASRAKGIPRSVYSSAK